MNNALDAQMIAAHEVGNKPDLIRLYTQAADISDDIDTACFYLTHAYIFALDTGAAETTILHARLVQHGREA